MSEKGVDVKSYIVNPFLLLYFTNEVIKTLFIICFGIIWHIFKLFPFLLYQNIVLKSKDIYIKIINIPKQLVEFQNISSKFAGGGGVIPLIET